MELIRLVEECSLAAWPALEENELDGWRLRFARGYTRRANSVTPLRPGAEETAGRIARCEEFYRARGLPCIFRITPLLHPPDLEEQLLERSYRREAETSVQLLEPLPPAPETAGGQGRRPRGGGGPLDPI